MTEENQIVKETKKCECLCQNKYFKKFVVISAGTFVGVFLALSLFAGLNKPPVPMPVPCPCQQMVRPDFGPQHFDRGHRGNFHKQMKKHVDKDIEYRANKPAPEIDD